MDLVVATVIDARDPAGFFAEAVSRLDSIRVIGVIFR
jgi:hypothetical protein